MTGFLIMIAGAAESAGSEKALPLIPRPVEIARGAGGFDLKAGAVLRHGASAGQAAGLLAADLSGRTGLDVKTEAAAGLPEFSLALGETSPGPKESPPERPEGYLL